MTNTLAYYGSELITAAKSFILQAPGNLLGPKGPRPLLGSNGTPAKQDKPARPAKPALSLTRSTGL